MGVRLSLARIFITAAAALAAPAFAEAHDLAFPSGPKALVGAWRLGQDGEGAPGCIVILGAAGVLGGYRMLVPPTCKGAIERYDELFAWFPGPKGELILVDAARQAIYRFHRLDGSTWATDGPADERYLLTKTSVYRHR